MKTYLQIEEKRLLKNIRVCSRLVKDANSQADFFSKQLRICFDEYSSFNRKKSVLASKKEVNAKCVE